ncbi:MAG: hypothetical protein AAFR35_10500 [Pseudomonadota bacterium]
MRTETRWLHSILAASETATLPLPWMREDRRKADPAEETVTPQTRTPVRS